MKLQSSGMAPTMATPHTYDDSSSLYHPLYGNLISPACNPKVDGSFTNTNRPKQLADDDNEEENNDSRITTRPSVIRFDLEHNAIYPIERIEDMDKNDHEAKWFKKSEYDKFMADSNMTVQLMKLGQRDPEEFDLCYRGLEYRLKASKRRRKNYIHHAFDAVLEEQQRQRKNKIHDSELLSIIYQGYSKPCVDNAIHMGYLDAQAAASHQAEVTAALLDDPHDKSVCGGIGECEYDSFFCDNSNGLSIDVVEIDEDNISIFSDDGQPLDDVSLYSTDSNTSAGSFVRRFKKLVQRANIRSTTSLTGRITTKNIHDENPRTTKPRQASFSMVSSDQCRN